MDAHTEVAPRPTVEQGPAQLGSNQSPLALTGAVFRSGSVSWVRVASQLACKTFDQMAGELKA